VYEQILQTSNTMALNSDRCVNVSSQFTSHRRTSKHCVITLFPTSSSTPESTYVRIIVSVIDTINTKTTQTKSWKNSIITSEPIFQKNTKCIWQRH